MQAPAGWLAWRRSRSCSRAPPRTGPRCGGGPCGTSWQLGWRGGPAWPLPCIFPSRSPAWRWYWRDSKVGPLLFGAAASLYRPGAALCSVVTLLCGATQYRPLSPMPDAEAPPPAAAPPRARTCAGVAALPSCVARMDAAELAARLQRRNPCRLPPLVYCGQGCDPLASHMIINPAGLTSEHQAGAQRPAEAAAAVAGGAGGAFQAVPEFYYFQAKLPASFLADTDLASPPFALPQGPATAGRPVPGPAPPSTGSAEPPPPPGAGLRMTQAARVWVSPQGAVSPTHYDLSHSFLTQVKGRWAARRPPPGLQHVPGPFPPAASPRRRGGQVATCAAPAAPAARAEPRPAPRRKRMLFWSPDQLACLYCYPDSHLLRRRSRLNMHAPLAAQPGDSSFPLAVRARAVQAVLEPGDVVFFPSRSAVCVLSLAVQPYSRVEKRAATNTLPPPGTPASHLNM